MKQAALKSIINDLNMAGIFDIPANSFMDFEKIESSPILNQTFKIENNDIQKLNLEIEPDENLPSSQDISNEINALFSSFNESKKSDDIDEDLELIEIKTIEAKKIIQEKTQKPKPRKEFKPKTNTDSKIDNQASIQKEEIKLPEPNYFIKSKNVENSKVITILNFKDENTFKSSEEYSLLQNILKTLQCKIEEASFIFIDNSYKKITLDHENYTQKLANELKKEVNSMSGGLIFSFGEDCLKLATDKNNTIRKSSNQLLESFNDKILLANYSLSAMMNTPKYKRLTWNNILLFKENNKDF